MSQFIRPGVRGGYKHSKRHKPCVVCGGELAPYRVTGGAGDKHKLQFWIHTLLHVSIEWDDKLCKNCHTLLRRVNLLAGKVQERFTENDKVVLGNTGSSSRVDSAQPELGESTERLNVGSSTSQPSLPTPSESASAVISQASSPAQSDDALPSSPQSDFSDSTHGDLSSHPQCTSSKLFSIEKSEIKTPAPAIVCPTKSSYPVGVSKLKGKSHTPAIIRLPVTSVRGISTKSKPHGDSDAAKSDGAATSEVNSSGGTDIGDPVHTFDTEIKQEVTDDEGEHVSPAALSPAIKLEDSSDTEFSLAGVADQTSDDIVTSPTVGVVDVQEVELPPARKDTSRSVPPPPSPDPLDRPVSACVVPNQETQLKVFQFKKISEGPDRGTRKRNRNRKFKMDYECERCKAKFRTPYGLRTHLQRPTPCEFRPGTSKEERLERMRASRRRAYYGMKARGLAERKEGQDPFICDVCGKGFYMKQYLTRHLLTHQPSNPYACDKCSFKAKSPKYLQIHKKVHNKDPYLCTECGKSFSRPATFKLHMKRHSNPYSCSHCDCKFADYADNLEHLSNVHGIREKPLRLNEWVEEIRVNGQFKCKVCEALLPTRSDFRYHSSHHTKDEWRSGAQSRLKVMTAKCKVCEAQFSSEASFRYHATFHTEGEWRSVGGNKSPEPVPTKNQERGSVREGKSAEPVTTEECSSLGGSKASKAVATKEQEDEASSSSEVESSDESKFVIIICSICGAHFEDELRYEQHCKTHHLSANKRTSGTTYSCAFCDFIAESRQELNKHLETHGNDESFRCKLCNAVFQTRGDLTQHLVMKH